MMIKMHQAALAAALALGSTAALAQGAPAPDWSFTGNAGLFSDYRFRGISQTNEKPAFQGGFDLAHSAGFYLGNWNSNIDSGFFGGANLEMDFYGGYKFALGELTLDLGALYYYYPGSRPRIDNTELYLGASFGPLTAKYSYAISDFFGFPDSSGSQYLDLGFSYALGNGLGINAHFGYQTLRGAARVVEIGALAPQDSISDWRLGLSYDLSGWVLGLAYVDTNRNLAGSASGGARNVSSSTVVLSLAKSF